MAIALSGSSDANNIAGTSSQVSSENKRNEGELVGGCSVCPSDQGTDDNPLVYCDGCEMAVHQACYGIISVPEGPWYCRKCESGGSQNKAKCALCPSGDGALKKTDNGQWAHVVCGLYIPEVRFGNTNTMEPIEIRYIRPLRMSKKCYLCDQGGDPTMAAYGAVIDCSEPGCKQSFHVTCGQSADLLCEKPVKDRDVIDYIGYCEQHFRKTKAAHRKSTNLISNSSSSILDSAGDSSQDNDSRCNISGQDKNSNPRPKFPAVPTLQVSPVSDQDDIRDPLMQEARKWASSNKTETTNEKNPVNGKTNSKKKPTSANAQSSVVTSTVTATTATTTIVATLSTSPPQVSTISTNSQSSTISNYNTNKMGSPNPSLSSTSPSNSNATTSSPASSSTSSASSTSSNSPSPALLSPNISSRKTSTARVESPLASNHKTGSNIDLHNKSPQESNLSGAARPPQGQNSIQARINLDSSKKNSSASSSLLSTAVPISLESSTNLTPDSSVTTAILTTGRSTINALPVPVSTSKIGNSNLPGGISLDPSSSLTGQTNSAFNTSTQPSLPPMAIPGPPSTSNSNSATTTNPTTKSTAKSRANVKVTRKKSTETNAESQLKPEAKPKASRAKKVPAAPANSCSSTETPKVETKRGKGKAAPKSTPTSSLPPNVPQGEIPTISKAKTATPTKRKSRTASVDANATVTSGPAPSPAKRPRKKKSDQIPRQNSQTPLNTNSSGTPHSTSSMQPLSATSNIQIGTNPLLINTPNTNNNRLLQVLNSGDGQDMSNRYFSPMISPYANFEHMNAPSLTRSSLSRLFTSSSVNNNNQPNPADDPAKAFEELRENNWSNLSKCVLEQAQQFDIPSLIGTLYSLRSENEKLVNKVRDLTIKRDQLVAMNARLDMPGPMLTQHLNNTSPNFSSVVSGLSNSPKILPTPSPGSTISKQPHISVSSFNHVPTGSICPGFLDRSSPLVGQTHSGLNNIKSSSMSTPSPPISALMAHSNNNRAGLISANSSFMPNVFPAMNTFGQLGTNSQGSSYYSRQ